MGGQCGVARAVVMVHVGGDPTLDREYVDP